MNKRLLIIVSYDSFIKSSLIVSKVFTDHDYIVDYYIALDDPDVKHIKDLGLKKIFKWGSLKKLFTEIDLTDYCAVYPHMDGTSVFRFFCRYYAIFGDNRMKRPIVFTGYVGIVYELYLKGFLERQPADVLYVNSSHDYRVFSTFCDILKLPSENIYITGLPFLDNVYARKKTPKNPAGVLLFAGQPTVPKTREERMYVVEQLIDYALRNRETVVYFKPRHKPEQTSFHVIDYHYENIIKSRQKLKDIPQNFILTYEPIQDLLVESDLLLTISSTAAYEAITMGVNVGFISDFGLREIYGNHYFLESNAFISFPELAAGRVPDVSQNWIEEYVKCDGNNSEDLFKAVDELVKKQNTAEKYLSLRPFYLAEKMKGYLNYRDKVPVAPDTFSGKIEKVLILFLGYLFKKRNIRKKMISLYSKLQLDNTRF